MTLITCIPSKSTILCDTAGFERFKRMNTYGLSMKVKGRYIEGISDTSQTYSCKVSNGDKIACFETRRETACTESLDDRQPDVIGSYIEIHGFKKVPKPPCSKSTTVFLQGI
jgi:hypothetical protein